MKKIPLPLLAGLVVLVLCGCHTAAPPSTSWEYRWVTPSRTTVQKELDAASRDGWEVISATPDVSPDAMSIILRRLKH